MKLNDRQIKQLKPKDKQYKVSDGRGLYLLVHPNGSKYWRQKVRFNGGKENTISHGVYPVVTLAEARQLALEVKRTLKAGVDPAAVKKAEKSRLRLENENQFSKIAREWHRVRQGKWSVTHATDVLGKLEKNVFPLLGEKPVTEITAHDVLEVIRRIEARRAIETAKRTLQIINGVFDYAIALGKADANPAYRLNKVLEVQKTEHYPCIGWNEFPELLKAITENTSNSDVLTLSAIKMLLLTFVRTSELINAKWSEIDLNAAQWIIPGERMKMGKDHIVPLSTQAIAILRELHQITGLTENIFSSPRAKSGVISNNTVNVALKRMGFKDRMCGHGFRAFAMTNIKEKLNYRHEVIDRQLAHAPKSKVAAAYDRAAFLEERAKMMQEWADLLGQVHSELRSRA